MSTIILSSILSKAGSIFGPIGQIVGSELGALLGAQLDNAIFGLDAEQKITHGARLKNLQVQTSTYGKAIPIIYGTARVAGNIIWSQPIKEEAITTQNKTGRGINITYNYYATLAIAICKGKVEKLNRIWAGTKSLSFDQIDYTFYHGREDQNPDSFMLSIEGEKNVPAYRGISYIVIKNFPLADYSNHVPVFTFEVVRPESLRSYCLKGEEFIQKETERILKLIKPDVLPSESTHQCESGNRLVPSDADNELPLEKEDAQS